MTVVREGEDDVIFGECADGLYVLMRKEETGVVKNTNVKVEDYVSCLQTVEQNERFYTKKKIDKSRKARRI